MKRLGKIACCAAAGLALGAGLRAANPYAAIPERNVFGLNPPKPHAAVNQPPAEPPPKITVNGITGVFGHWQVLFKVAAGPQPPGKHPKPAKDNYYMLSEGERQDDIEVKRIDDQAKPPVITFNNHGVIQELTLADTPKTSAPAPHVASIPGPGGRLSLPPGAHLPAHLPPALAARIAQARANAARHNAVSAPAAVGVPAPTHGTPAEAQANQKPLSPEEQMLMIAAEHAKAQAEGNPIAKIYPPTPLDKAAGVSDNSAGSGPPSPPIPGGTPSK